MALSLSCTVDMGVGRGHQHLHASFLGDEQYQNQALGAVKTTLLGDLQKFCSHVNDPWSVRSKNFLPARYG